MWRQSCQEMMKHTGWFRFSWDFAPRQKKYFTTSIPQDIILHSRPMLCINGQLLPCGSHLCVITLSLLQYSHIHKYNLWIILLCTPGIGYCQRSLSRTHFLMRGERPGICKTNNLHFFLNHPFLCNVHFHFFLNHLFLLDSIAVSVFADIFIELT